MAFRQVRRPLISGTERVLVSNFREIGSTSRTGAKLSPVASVTSLFNSPAADITLGQVRALVSQNLPEA